MKVIGLNNKTSIPQVESAITKAFKLTPPFVIKLKDLEGCCKKCFVFVFFFFFNLEEKAI